MAVRCVLGFALLSAGCFSPTATPGGPCGEGGFCPDDLICLGGRCALPDSVSDGLNVVFATSTAFAADEIGGTAGADDKCNAAAQLAGLSGRFQAYLSDSNSDALVRLRATTAQGWIRLDDLPFADTVDDLEEGRVYFPALLDETGAVLSGAEVWTGTTSSGLRGSDCDNWATTDPGSEADISTTTQTVGFGGGRPGSCAESRHLLCLGVDRRGQVDVVPVDGPTIFLSQPFELTAAGRDAADAQCQSEAEANGLAGQNQTFRAYLAGTLESPSFAAPNAGDVWVRVDGVPVGGNLYIDRLDTSVSVTADGDYVDARVWLGTDNPLLRHPTPAASCSDWSDPDQTAPGITASSSGDALWFAPSDGDCGDQQTRLYCVEQVEYNRVFVTSAGQTIANFGSVSGADALCDSAGDTRLGPGTYIAYLSDDGTHAVDRLTGSSARGWVRPDGRPFADTVENMHSGAVFYPPTIDETGGAVVGGIWTGSGSDGRAAAENCGNWQVPSGTGAVGHSSRTTAFGSLETSDCDASRRLLCFQVDHNKPVAPSPARGRVAFLGPEFLPNTDGMGRAAASGICQDAADAASLTGDFDAVLAGPNTASSSFVGPGPVWTRVDGIQLVDDVGDIERNRLATSISVDAQGNYVAPNAPVWTGSLSPSAGVGGTDDSCEDWSTDAASAFVAASADSQWFRALGPNKLPCTTPNVRLYCLQQ